MTNPSKNQSRKQLKTSTLAQMSYLPYSFGLVWRSSQGWTVIWVCLFVIQGLLPAATVYLTRSVVDSLVAVAGNGISFDNIQAILVPGLAMAGIQLLTQLLQATTEFVRTAQSELVQDYISALVHRQSATIDFSCYETSEFNDYLSRARDGANTQPLTLIENCGSLLQNSITLLTMSAILLSYGLLLPIILTISILPALYVVFHLNKHQHEWWQETTTTRRKLQYYELLLTSNWTAAELRLFNLGHYFQSNYQQLRKYLREEQLKLIRNHSLGRFGAGLATLLISSLAIVWMGQQALLGIISIGDLALFYQAFTKGQAIIKSLLSNLSQIYRNSLFIGDLFTFLNLRPQLVSPVQCSSVPLKLKQGICFRQVTFRYPGSEQAVLKDFNLTIPAGKIVAIVGDNGAGKSTLIKLLCRLYDPDAGQIQLDGINLSDFSLEELRRQITILFQLPVTYQFTAAQNIALGDLSANPSQTNIETAAKQAGIHEKIMSLPQQYDSQLGKWFPGGTDLSGGEWQRLALARAFLRKAELIILDEPTSAMDPWAEFDWLERFREMANDRTALVITHRFTLAMRADIIHVMKKGQIVESGSHDQLLAQNGFYAESWRSQMQTNTDLVESNSI